MPLNKETLDRLRTNLEFGDGTKNELCITSGAQAAVGDAISGLMFEFATFVDWDDGWDAEDLHEIGIIPFDGTDIMFKIDLINSKEDIYRVTFLLPTEW